MNTCSPHHHSCAMKLSTVPRSFSSPLFADCLQLIAMSMIAIGVYARVVKHAGKSVIAIGNQMNQHKKFQPAIDSFPIETALACLAVDPAMMLLVVGVLMFIITFCGCVGSLRENICLLQFVGCRFGGRRSCQAKQLTLFFFFLFILFFLQFCISLTVIFLLQLAAGVLGFIFSDKVNRFFIFIFAFFIVAYVRSNDHIWVFCPNCMVL